MNTYKNLIFVFVWLLLLSQTVYAEGSLYNTSKRFQVEIEGTFHDNKAYGGLRKIYIITDKVSGVEYLGLTGIGITEVVQKIKAGPVRFKKQER